MEKNALIGLDLPEEWAKFSYHPVESSDKWESHIVVDGMHCAACAVNVEKALLSVEGVVRADVNATSKRAKVVWASSLTKPSEWMLALTDSGYPAVPANEIFELNERKKQKRLMLWRLLVAGFCMMQVMMYAYPTYIAASGEMGADILNLFRWASWILTLPVILFSSSPFFTNALHDLKNRQISMDLPVALGITITFVVSTAATFNPDGWWGHETYFDSLTMFVFFLLCGRWLELRMRDKTAGSLDVLMRRIPASVQRLKQDRLETIPASQIVLGDVIRILPGEAFPADGVVLQGESSADEALLTGESTPVPKRVGDEVIAGSHNLHAVIDFRVDKIGNTTRYAQIVDLMRQASVEKPRLALMADKVAKPFLFFVIFAAILAASLLWSKDHGQALMAAVSVLIVTCPCALSLATPAAMLTVSGALAKTGVLVKRMQALEAISSIDNLFFDKTGTLTVGQQRLVAVNVHSSDNLTSYEALQFAASLASNSLHPVSQALLDAFRSESKSLLPMMDSRETAGAGIEGAYLGHRYKLGSAKFCQIEQFTKTSEASVFLTRDGILLASFLLEEEIKPDVIRSIQKLKMIGVDVHILSGDQANAVNRIAQKVGVEHAFGNCTPQDKLDRLKKLQQSGHKVAMIGDGLNDGPVLASADASIAMGQGVPLAQSQSDFIILNNDITSVVTIVTESRRTMRIIKQNLTWAFIYNAVCVPIAILGMLPAWLAGLGMALSSLLVVGNAFRLSSLRSEGK